MQQLLRSRKEHGNTVNGSKRPPFGRHPSSPAASKCRTISGGSTSGGAPAAPTRRRRSRVLPAALGASGRRSARRSRPGRRGRRAVSRTLPAWPSRRPGGAYILVHPAQQHFRRRAGVKVGVGKLGQRRTVRQTGGGEVVCRLTDVQPDPGHGGAALFDQDAADLAAASSTSFGHLIARLQAGQHAAPSRTRPRRPRRSARPAGAAPAAETAAATATRRRRAGTASCGRADRGRPSVRRPAWPRRRWPGRPPAAPPRVGAVHSVEVRGRGGRVGEYPDSIRHGSIGQVIQGNVQGRGRVRQGADADAIHARSPRSAAASPASRRRTPPAARPAPTALRRRTASRIWSGFMLSSSTMSGLAARAASNCVEIVDLDFEREARAELLPRPPHRLGDGARAADRGEVIVLDEHAVAEAHAMVVAAATAHRVFLQQPPARRRLARVQHLTRQSGHGLDVACRRGGDAAEPLQKVQRRPFAG